MINQARIFLCIVFVLLSGCKKFLEEKPNAKQVVPSGVQDLQAILDDTQFLNYRNPRAAELSADDLYLMDDAWEGLTEWDFNIYTWGKKGLFPSSVVNNDWSNAYYNVQIANQVLAIVDNVPGSKEELNNVKGQALFYRAAAFLQIAAIWANAYDKKTADKKLGIPLRVDADFTKKTTRANLAQTYDRIIVDLMNAADLLPVYPKHVLRASKPAAYALLARTCLAMGDFIRMGTYANLCLTLTDTLNDYNFLDTSSNISYPFVPKNNVEIIYQSGMMSAPALHASIAIMDSTLYNMYAANDLRKTLFFKRNKDGTHGFKGNYTGAATLFSGITTSEVYLMRAEAFARAENINSAMVDLNKLVRSRTVTGTFVPLSADNPDAALALILNERRKELVMRGLRWLDIKRLNIEGKNIKLKRIVNGVTYMLPPNDKRYALQIPEEVISMSGIEQNP